MEHTLRWNKVIGLCCALQGFGLYFLNTWSNVPRAKRGLEKASAVSFNG